MRRMKGFSPKSFIALLTENGWELSHHKSNHYTYRHPGKKNIITVPDHQGELSRPLAKRLLKEAGLLNGVN
jgi:predicted RNA binding protein YcfA (HicA-like mRNA interferase family)